MVPFNIADLLLTDVESTHWVLSCNFLKFKQGLVTPSNAYSDKQGPHGCGTVSSGMTNAYSTGYEQRGKQVPLCTPQWKGKGVCVRMPSLYFQTGNAISLASGLKGKCTDGPFEKLIAQMP